MISGLDKNGMLGTLPAPSIDLEKNFSEYIGKSLVNILEYFSYTQVQTQLL